MKINPKNADIVLESGNDFFYTYSGGNTCVGQILTAYEKYLTPNVMCEVSHSMENQLRLIDVHLGTIETIRELLSHKNFDIMVLEDLSMFFNALILDKNTFKGISHIDTHKEIFKLLGKDIQDRSKLGLKKELEDDIKIFLSVIHTYTIHHNGSSCSDLMKESYIHTVSDIIKEIESYLEYKKDVFTECHESPEELKKVLNLR